MADKMYLIITIRKEVEDRIEGRQVYNRIKNLIGVEAEIDIKGQVSNHFLDEDE